MITVKQERVTGPDQPIPLPNLHSTPSARPPLIVVYRKAHFRNKEFWDRVPEKDWEVTEEGLIFKGGETEIMVIVTQIEGADRR